MAPIPHRSRNPEELSEIDSAVAQELCKREGPLKLNGITSLSPQVAEVLGTFKGPIELNGLKELSNQAAWALTKQGLADVSLNGLKSLSPIAAQCLSANAGELRLNGLKSLSPDLANALGGHKGYLYLNGLSSLPKAIAKALSRHEGEPWGEGRALRRDQYSYFADHFSDSLLSLDGVRELSDSCAELLGQAHSSLSLNGLRALTPTGVSLLLGGKQMGPRLLRLNGLTSLDPEVATQLARGADREHPFRLELNGLQCLPAELLAGIREPHVLVALNGVASLEGKGLPASGLVCGLELNGISDLAGEGLDDRVVGLLTSCSSLSLDGLAQLDLRLAQILSGSSCGYLAFNGLRSLDLAAASLLGQNQARLLLNGLVSLTDEQCGALVGEGQRTDRLQVRGLTELSPAVARAVERVGARPSAAVTEQTTASELSQLRKLRTVRFLSDDVWLGPDLETLDLGEASCIAKNVPNLGDRNKWPNLRSVRIAHCPSLTAFEFTEVADGLVAEGQPVEIAIRDCHGLTSIKVASGRVSSKNLDLRELSKCTSLSLSLVDLEDLQGLNGLNAVQALELHACPQLKSLQGVEHWGSLCKLTMSRCPELKSIAGVESLRLLSSVSIGRNIPIADLYLLAGRDQLDLSVQSRRAKLSLGVARRISLPIGKSDLSGFLELVGPALVACDSCGNTELSGKCSGWVDGLELGPIEEAIRVNGELSDSIFADLTDDLAVKIEEVFQRGTQGQSDDEDDEEVELLDYTYSSRNYSEITAEVACGECSAPFDPSSIGHKWKEFAADQSFGDVRASDYDVKLTVSKRVSGLLPALPQASAQLYCPVCHQAGWELATRGVIKKSGQSRFWGTIDVSNTSWDGLGTCVEIEDEDEKFGSSWDWEVEPGREGLLLRCRSGCFSAKVTGLWDVRVALLAVCAIADVNSWLEFSPRVSRLRASLGVGCGDPVQVVKAVHACLDQSEVAVPGLMDAAAVRAIKAKAANLLTSVPRTAAVRVGASAGAPLALAGRVVLFHGKLSGLTKAEAIRHATSLGATVATRMSRKVTDVVVGRKGHEGFQAPSLDAQLVHHEESFLALLASMKA